ncbi:hypothetical protein [Halobacteriovorax marinus]|nr:hypothetical protein [Halobacteriovorax marinus]
MMEKTKLKFLLLFFLLFILLNILVNQPFLAISYFPRTERLILEGGILLVLFFVGVWDRSYTELLLTVCGFVLMLATCYIYSEDPFRYIGSANKLAFGLLFFSFVGSRVCLLKWFSGLWIVVWIAIGFWTIFGSWYYFFDPQQLPVVNFSSVDKFANYPYKVSRFGHFIIENKVFGLFIGRNTGVFFEPNQLGFFAWLNFFFAESACKSKKWKLRYQLLSLVIGLLSFSLAFYGMVFLAIVSFLVLKIKRRELRGYVFLVLILIVLLCLNLYQFEETLIGSVGNRIDRFRGGVSVLRGNSIVSFFLGNGFNAPYLYMPFSFSSGYFDLLAIKGFLFFSLVFYFILRVTWGDLGLMLSLFLYFLVTNPFQYLLFYFLIVLIHCLKSSKNTYFKQKL